MSNTAQTNSRQIFVGNLSSKTTEETLLYFFLNFGTVTKVKVLRHDDGSPKHAAFVTFKEASMATAALSADGNEIDGRKIICGRPTRRVHDTPPVSQISELEPKYSREVFVANLPQHTCSKKLKKYFEKYGEIEKVNTFSRVESDVIKWYGFVIFEKARSVDVVQRCRPHQLEDKVLFTQRSFPEATRLEDRGENNTLIAFNYESKVEEDDLIRYFQQYGSMKIICKSKGRKTFMMFEFDDYDVVDQLCLKTCHQLAWGAPFNVMKCHDHFFEITDGKQHIPFDGNTLTFYHWRWLNNSINPDISITYSHDEEEENEDNTQAENPITDNTTIVNVPNNIVRIQGPTGSGHYQHASLERSLGYCAQLPRHTFGSNPRPRFRLEAFGSNPHRQQSSVLGQSVSSDTSRLPQIPTRFVQDQTAFSVKPQSQADIEAEEEAKILKIFLERLKASTDKNTRITADYRKNKMFNEFYEQRDQAGKMAPLLSASEGKIFVRYLEKTYFGANTSKRHQNSEEIPLKDASLKNKGISKQQSLKKSPTTAASNSTKKDQKTCPENFPKSMGTGAASSSSVSDDSKTPINKEFRNDGLTALGSSSTFLKNHQPILNPLHIQQNSPRPPSLPLLADFFSLLSVEDDDLDNPGILSLRDLITSLAPNYNYKSIAPTRRHDPLWPVYPDNQSNEEYVQNLYRMASSRPSDRNEEIEDQNEVIGGKPKWVWDNIKRNYYNK